MAAWTSASAPGQATVISAGWVTRGTTIDGAEGCHCDDKHQEDLADEHGRPTPA